jgi:hypothetical protein
VDGSAIHGVFFRASRAFPEFLRLFGGNPKGEKIAFPLKRHKSF